MAEERTRYNHRTMEIVVDCLAVTVFPIVIVPILSFLSHPIARYGKMITNKTNATAGVVVVVCGMN